MAVVDPSDERRKAAGDDFPGLTAYASVDDLATDGDVDLAIVATPPAYPVALEPTTPTKDGFLTVT